MPAFKIASVPAGAAATFSDSGSAFGNDMESKLVMDNERHAASQRLHENGRRTSLSAHSRN